MVKPLKNEGLLYWNTKNTSDWQLDEKFTIVI
jgi:hypothetical protein